MCMCGVKQTAVLLQSRHHESVYVVLADGKRIPSYIISICMYIIYDGIKLAPIKQSLPSTYHRIPLMRPLASRIK